MERPGRVTADDEFLFHAGNLHRAHERLGCHLGDHGGTRGAWFAVWAPHAREVSVIGSFNGWAPGETPLHAVESSGIWEEFVPGVAKGDRYKFHIRSERDDYWVDKADPYGVYHEEPPRTASIAWDLDYTWNDGAWMASRAGHNALDAPMSTYEVHLGSWRRPDGGMPRYRDVAPSLAGYCVEMGFTHVELLPIMEHPFYGSWGYQVTGGFAPTSRHGTPQEFMELVDTLHRAGIGVILDWVPSHFPTDEHGLAFFDGTHLYEHADPRQGLHPDWRTYIYNYNVGAVVSYLVSSAMHWLDRYHIDGLRVDAVASMLYLDYSRDEDAWVPNRHGGRENLEAIEFLRNLNTAVYEAFPDVQMIAEESTSWPQVSRPVYLGGLGFGMKWDMGWMHDTLEILSMDPVFRGNHHEKLTFRQMYAWSENFVLSLSHDEVVHGKRSVLDKMWGNAPAKFAQLRLLYGYMTGLPGKKLLFMGDEFGGDRGFRWINCHDHDNSVLAWLRLGDDGDAPTLVVCNFTPIERSGYRLGVPTGGRWVELLNSDAAVYGGDDAGNLGGVDAEPIPSHGHDMSIGLTLPSFGALFLRPGPDEPADDGAAAPDLDEA